MPRDPLPRRSVGAPRKPSFVCGYTPAGLIDERKVLLLVRQCILRVAWTVCRRCVVDDEGERKVLLLERQRILGGLGRHVEGALSSTGLPSGKFCPPLK